MIVFLSITALNFGESFQDTLSNNTCREDLIR